MSTKKLVHWLDTGSAWWFFRLSSSMWFFWGMLLFEILWVGWNLAVPSPLQFDKAPGFVILLLLGNQVQLYYLPVIQSAQRVISAQGDQRQEDMRLLLQSVRDMMVAQVTTMERYRTLEENQTKMLQNLEQVIEKMRVYDKATDKDIDEILAWVREQKSKEGTQHA